MKKNSLKKKLLRNSLDKNRKKLSNASEEADKKIPLPEPKPKNPMPISLSEKEINQQKLDKIFKDADQIS